MKFQFTKVHKIQKYHMILRGKISKITENYRFFSEMGDETHDRYFAKDTMVAKEGFERDRIKRPDLCPCQPLEIRAERK